MLNRLSNSLHEATSSGPRWKRVTYLVAVLVAIVALACVAVVLGGDLSFTPRTQTWVVSLCCMFICISGLTRNFLLGPHTPNWPPAPFKVRVGIVVLMLISGFVGTRGLTILATDTYSAPPLVVNPGFTVLAVGLAFYKAMMLWNTASDFHPVRYWQAMARAADRYCPRAHR